MVTKDIKVKDITMEVSILFNVDKHKKTPEELVSLLRQAGLDNAIEASVRRKDSKHKHSDVG